MVKREAVIISFLFFALIQSISYAQIGEIAGALVYNVSVGSSNTSHLTIFNSGTSPIHFSVGLPQFNPIPNETSPTVFIYPMNGTIAPQESYKLNVTVYMPGNDKPKTKWDGLIQVVQIANQTIVGGATVQAGVGKEIIIM